MTRAITRFFVPLFFALCLLMGGASNGGYVANFVLQIAGIGLVVLTLAGKTENSARGPDTLLKLALAFAALLILIQFVPLPYELWRSLPGREPYADALGMIGITPTPATVSLSFHDSLASLAWGLPAICFAVLLAGRGTPDVKPLAYVLIAFSFLSIGLGLVQFTGDPQSPVYLYSFTNRGLMVGFFSNANHMATLLLVTLPYLAALIRSIIAARRQQRGELLFLAATLSGFFVIGIALVGSLTGYALAIPVLSLSAIILFPDAGRIAKLAVIPALALGAGIIAFTDEGGNIFADENSLSQRGRDQIFATTSEAIAEYWPVGTGLGTFRDIYDDYEAPNAVDTTFVNHAHSDYLEIALEFGLPGVLAISVFLAWWILRLRSLWEVLLDQPFTQAAAIGSGVILLHSAWDYPLRTAALGAVFALSCVILMRAPVNQARGDDRATSLAT